MNEQRIREVLKGIVPTERQIQVAVKALLTEQVTARDVERCRKYVNTKGKTQQIYHLYDFDRRPFYAVGPEGAAYTYSNCARPAAAELAELINSHEGSDQYFSSFSHWVNE